MKKIFMIICCVLLILLLCCSIICIIELNHQTELKNVKTITSASESSKSITSSPYTNTIALNGVNTAYLNNVSHDTKITITKLKSKIMTTAQSVTTKKSITKTKFTNKKIKKRKNKVNKIKKSYTNNELYILSHLIYGEASGRSKSYKIAIGSVVLNRVKSDRFPNTVKGVVFQNGQYACTWDGNYDKKPDKQTINVAKYLLKNGSQIPDYVIFQAEFFQGDSVWKRMGNTYFCYYKKDKNSNKLKR